MPSEPTLCHINLARGFRGGERQTELLIRALSTLGWRQRLIVRKGSALTPRVQEIGNLQTIEVAPNAAAAAVATRGCQLGHAHEAKALYAGMLGKCLFGIPFVGTRRIIKPFGASPLRDMAYRRAARIVVLSRAIEALVKQKYPGVRCEIIADAHADLARQHEPQEELIDRYRGKTVVGHIGALVARDKGQHLIIEIARRWQHSHPDTVFVLVGSGKDSAAFREMAAGLRNLVFAGHADNVGDYLDLFDVFVFPSLMEGLGSTLLDAMCFGLPIVASNVGGIPDIIEQGVNGLLVNPDDSRQLESALDSLLQDPSLQQSMRTQNLEKAGLYTAAAMAKSYDTLYRKLVGPVSPND